MPNKDIISVIIPTRNRAALLDKALQSILDQTCEPDCFEVIVIDNGSTDNTKQIAEKYAAKIKNFNYQYNSQPGLHVGRHTGLEAAKGSILVYADDDIRAMPTWLDGITESFSDANVALVGGNNYPDYESNPPQWVEALWTKTPWGKANSHFSILDFGNNITEISPLYVWGCNFSIRKSVLLEFGGFHPDGMPEELLRFRGDGETAVSQAILANGYRTIFNPHASIYHFVPQSRMTFEYLFKRSYAQGISDSYTAIRTGMANSIMKKYKLQIRYIYTQLRVLFRRERTYLKYISKGYYRGYFYHQRQAHMDPELRNWILQKTYIQ